MPLSIDERRIPKFLMNFELHPPNAGWWNCTELHNVWLGKGEKSWKRFNVKKIMGLFSLEQDDNICTVTCQRQGEWRIVSSHETPQGIRTREVLRLDIRQHTQAASNEAVQNDGANTGIQPGAAHSIFLGKCIIHKYYAKNDAEQRNE
jgi:hypothetical protein